MKYESYFSNSRPSFRSLSWKVHNERYNLVFPANGNNCLYGVPRVPILRVKDLVKVNVFSPLFVNNNSAKLFYFFCCCMHIFRHHFTFHWQHATFDPFLLRIAATTHPIFYFSWYCQSDCWFWFSTNYNWGSVDFLQSLVYEYDCCLLLKFRFSAYLWVLHSIF